MSVCEASHFCAMEKSASEIFLELAKAEKEGKSYDRLPPSPAGRKFPDGRTVRESVSESLFGCSSLAGLRTPSLVILTFCKEDALMTCSISTKERGWRAKMSQ